jgi:hypothetical protein
METTPPLQCNSTSLEDNLREQRNEKEEKLYDHKEMYYLECKLESLQQTHQVITCQNGDWYRGNKKYNATLDLPCTLPNTCSTDEIFDESLHGIDANRTVLDGYYTHLECRVDYNTFGTEESAEVTCINGLWLTQGVQFDRKRHLNCAKSFIPQLI